MDNNFEEILQDTYEKTLKLAVGIAQNKASLLKTSVNGNDLKFVKKIAKDLKDFQDLSERGNKRPKKMIQKLDTIITSPLKNQNNAALPKYSGKHKLNHSLDERNKYVSDSKAGKPVKYAEIGPNILEKIKQNSSIYSDESRVSLLDKTLSSHVSVITGKVKPALELPSFKDYIKSERSKDPKDIAFERIKKCDKLLLNFEKEMSGLELFLSANPEIPWNNDKKILLRLNAHPNQKGLILKAYNDQFNASHRKHLTKKISLIEKEKKFCQGEAFLSKTPNPQSMEDYYLKKQVINKEAGAIVKRCYNRFQNARDRQNKKLIDILDSLNVTRSVNLKQKAVYILNDREKFKDKLYSIQKMDQIKKKIDFDQETRLKKSKEQAVIYDKLMEFLKRKVNGPNDIEINFVEILKEILEEGWYIDDNLIQKITEVIPEEDVKEISPLIEFLKAELENIEYSN